MENFLRIFVRVYSSCGGSYLGNSADLAGLSTYEMKQWRAHPQAKAHIDKAINLNLEESLGTLAQATPALANRLIYMPLIEK